MQIADAGFLRRPLGHIHHRTAQPAPAIRLHQMQFVDEAVGAAIFDREAERQHQIAGNRVAVADDEGPRIGLARAKAVERRALLGRVVFMPVKGVIVAHQRFQHRAVGRRDGVECQGVAHGRNLSARRSSVVK